MSSTPLSLIRYLIVLETTSSLVRLPPWPAHEFTRAAGNMVADQLPTAQARPWIKLLKGPDGNPVREIKKYPCMAERPWPLDAVVFWHPAKRTYGSGEKILFELKLIGDSADHGAFMEALLPALETLGHAPSGLELYPNCLWGHYNIQSVYTARGMHWKPLIRDGRLDLRYKVTPAQWRKGLSIKSLDAPHRLTWLMPFQLPQGDPAAPGAKTMSAGPSLHEILTAVLARVAEVALGKRSSSKDYLETLEKEERAAWEAALHQASKNRVISKNIKKVTFKSVERFAGFQKFVSPIPPEVLEFLQLGTIFHIGRDARYGYGTFTVS